MRPDVDGAVELDALGVAGIDLEPDGVGPDF